MVIAVAYCSYELTPDGVILDQISATPIPKSAEYHAKAAKAAEIGAYDKKFEAMLRERGDIDDATTRGQLNFQTPATEIMEKIVDLHNDLFFFIVVIVIFVS